MYGINGEALQLHARICIRYYKSRVWVWTCNEIKNHCHHSINLYQKKKSLICFRMFFWDVRFILKCFFSAAVSLQFLPVSAEVPPTTPKRLATVDLKPLWHVTLDSTDPPNSQFFSVSPPTISICPLFGLSLLFLFFVLLCYKPLSFHMLFIVPFHSPLLHTFSHSISLLSLFSPLLSTLCSHICIRRYQGSDLPSSS